MSMGFEWIPSGPQNRLQDEIEGRSVALRCRAETEKLAERALLARRDKNSPWVPCF